MPPVPVAVATAIQKNIPVQIEAIGTVEASQTISVKTRITGQITEVYFKEGQDARKGDLLLSMDCRSYDAALKQAEANLNRDKALLENAEETLRRYTDLVEKGYVAREQYDQVRTNWAALEATVKADIAVVENNLVQTQYCAIYSPIDGRTGMLKVNQGNIVKADETEVVTINQIQPVNVSFAIPEKDLLKVRKLLSEKKLEIDACIPGEELPEKGALTFVDNAIDTARGTITLRGTFDNREKRLVPGQFVNVILTLSIQPNAILVPSQSVEQGQVGQYVFVISPDSNAEMRQVTIGQDIKDETVILKGIRAGERVVTDGQMRLLPGSRVTIKEIK
ncbi:MAG: efflux RND transporter periplasmic adaptor subunit [Deltaproteobacteria bacterium]|nr:efflux RND transporter periplasmic adaptor subunit [Deltaproteobacteria bacterium]